MKNIKQNIYKKDDIGINALCANIDAKKKVGQHYAVFAGIMQKSKE